MGVTSLEFTIEGKKSLVPEKWQSIALFFTWGQFSNQPSISTKKFTFSGDSAITIYKHYKSGYILRGLEVSLLAKQTIDNKEYSVDLFKGFIINLTKGVVINDPDFNGDNPKSITVTIEKKNSINSIKTQLKGINWDYLDYKGKVSGSDYTTVRTKVQPIYNAKDIALALVSIYMIVVQIRSLAKETSKDLADLVTRLTGTDLPRTAANIAYLITISALKIATIALLIVSLVSLVTDLLSLLLSPTIKNKGITWRRGLEIIFEFIGYNFVSTLTELDQEVILPSNPNFEDGKPLKELINKFKGIRKGYPHANDYGYNASGFVEMAKVRFNGKFDVIGNTITLKWVGDKSKLSAFKSKIDVLTESFEPNIEDIPAKTTYSFLTDPEDGYTTKNYKGTKFHVINESKHLPFTESKNINFNLALGSSKDKLDLMEKYMSLLAGTADQLINLFGGNSNLKGKIKANNTGVLKVSSNNYSVAKLVPIINGRMPSNHREITSAKAIENKYYITESIKRGTGQKYIVNNWKTPFTLKNSEELSNNGTLIDSRGNLVRVKELEYFGANDTANGVLEVDYNYIAKSDFEEILIESDINV